MDREHPSVFRCGVCGGNRASRTYEAREMMLGLRTRFHYAQCAECDSLWLTSLPADLAVYYPSHYGAFANGDGGASGWVKKYLRAKRDGAYFGGGTLFGRFLARRFQDDGALLSVSKLNMEPDARILDVGCGGGKLLRRMAAIGFKNLSGVDLFLSKEFSETDGVRIRKCRLEDLRREKYDVVMFHHSLEHITDPHGTLRTAAKLLARGGKCLVRLPVVAHAWEKYGTNWVQLDPPRHVWLPTEKAMRKLAAYTGFRVERVEYDSTEFQFWASELYARDVAQNEGSRFSVRRHSNREEIKELRAMARRLNDAQLGDQAAFYLTVATNGGE